MLPRIARLVVRRPLLVVLATVIFLVASGAFGGSVVNDLKSGGFEDPNSESTIASELLEEEFGTGIPNFILLVDAGEGSVDDPDVAKVGLELTERLSSEEGVADVISYWALGSPPPLRSEDSTQAQILGRITGSETEAEERAGELREEFEGANDGVRVSVGGQAEVSRQIGTTVEKDLQRAELIAGPVTLLLLILVFGSVVAASLPLLAGVFAVIGTFGVLKIISSVTDVSIFALNLTTALGLGLAIDYSLFIVSRYREEMAKGYPPKEAVARSVQTAGRTVAFSALTVLISLSALLVFPQYFLRSFAYAGVAVVAISAIGAVIALPAILVLLGDRVDKLVVRRPKLAPAGTGFWHDTARRVMRRPLLVGGTVVALLLLLGVPFLRVDLGLTDDRVLPPTNPGRAVSDQIRANFTSSEAGALSVVAADIGDPENRQEEIESYAMELSSNEAVARVDGLTGVYQGGRKVAPASPASARFATDDSTFLSVVPAVEPLSEEGEQLVSDVRAASSPFPTRVTGTSAVLVDSKQSVFARLPFAAALIVLVTFVLLFLMFGSVVVPAKAVVLNLLSLTAVFGAMVWIFQDGRFSDVLNFTPTGTIDLSSPILMFCIAFGLSMDYEVFLLSRIKEEYDATGDNLTATAVGLQRTGGIVTAAAALLAVVFLAFSTSQVAFIKLFGLGLMLAVLMDATLIRATLVPVFMRLAGPANWWAPGPLRRFHNRFGISEHVDLDDAGAGVAAKT